MARVRVKSTLFLLVLTATLVFSCDRNRLYEEHAALAKDSWNVNDRIAFTVTIPDPVCCYNIYLDIRNGRDYPYSNLYLFMNTEMPGGGVSRDTIELTLADYDGRWLGSGMGNVKFSRFLLRRGFGFPQTGQYRFVFEQAMRVNALKGILDIGLRVEKQQEK
jgi:gliding motility-associated lipoprotein GldH